MASRQVILVATDLGEAADEAIREAHRWAKERSAHLAVCFVIPTRLREESCFPPAYADDAVAQLELERRAEEMVRDRVQKLTGRGEEVDVVIEAGRADLGIVQLSAELRVSLIAVGNRRSNEMERLLLGSISERVVRYADCSVLVARRSPSTRRILIATDLSDIGLPAVNAGLEAAAKRKAPVTILHCIETPIGAEPKTRARARSKSRTPTKRLAKRVHMMEGMKDLLARKRLKGDVEVIEGRPADVVLERARELDAHLIVVGTRGRTGLSRMAFGSVAETVARDANCSVLAVRLQGVSDSAQD
jgi:nucleotide-binding universal stress UspA family protein